MIIEEEGVTGSDFLNTLQENNVTFLSDLVENILNLPKGYVIKQGKHLAIRPPGMDRFKRCKSLGEEYCEEQIRERILNETLSE